MSALEGWLLCVAISAAYVIVLGIPTFLLLRWRNLVRWWTTISGGFLLGAVPVAVISWPLRYSELRSSATIDGVQTIINGVPTLAGWLQYLEGLSFMGACGVIGATAFWLIRRRSPNYSLKRIAADGLR